MYYPHPQRVTQRALEQCALKVESARHGRRPAPHGKRAAGKHRLAHLLGCDAALETGTDLPSKIWATLQPSRGKLGETSRECGMNGCERHGYDFLMGMSTYRKLGSPRGCSIAGLDVFVVANSNSSVAIASTPSRRYR